MKYLLLFVTLFCASSVCAQDRYSMSTPTFELAKIKALLAKTETKGEFYFSRKLTAEEYMGLSLREKFTYNMINAESYSQSCSIVVPAPDEHKKIFAYTADPFGELYWSGRQYNFLRGNRDSVMALINISVKESKRMGANYKDAVIRVEGWEMIPFLTDLYNVDKKDHDLLTLMMLLMKMHKYEPFMRTALFNKVYVENHNRRSFIELNEENQNLIMEHAANFYKSKK
jgi:hypothetical protein